jgi:glycosyltransferase involved in cell wall biosynthesis
MRISLVLATIGRTAEVKRLLASLEAQTHRDFDVIVVDQNADERLTPMLAEFVGKLDLRHRPLAGPPGASRARNIGIADATGEIVCFPDDDCWYSKDFLHRVNDLLCAHPEWDALIGDAVDESGRPIVPWTDRSGPLTKPMCWRRALCVASVLRSHVLREIGGFDETLGGGSGTRWASGEDNDLMLRALERGFRIRYERGVRIYHPQMFTSFDERSRSKRYAYSLGDGNLLRRHPMPLWWRALFFGVPVGRMVLAGLKFARDEALYHWSTCVGRVQGFRLST